MVSKIRLLEFAGQLDASIGDPTTLVAGFFRAPLWSFCGDCRLGQNGALPRGGADDVATRLNRQSN